MESIKKRLNGNYTVSVGSAIIGGTVATSSVIYGDESGRIGKDRYFCLGVLGTRDPRTVYDELGVIRKRTNYGQEVTYKSSDERRALCAIRWMDWFFSGQSAAKFRILLKDKTKFNVGYFENNIFDAGAGSLAYCESYKETLNNFADFKEDKKYFVYHQISLRQLKVDEYLEGKVSGLEKKRCYPHSTLKKKPRSEDFTLHSEMLQLTDLLTGSFRNLVNAWANEQPVPKSWVKRVYTKILSIIYQTLKQKS